MSDTYDSDTKGKRGKGPLVIQYIDNSGKLYKRIPSEANGVQIDERMTGGKQAYSLEDLSPEVIHQLAVAGLKRVLETATRNGANDEGNNILAIAGDTFAMLKSGAMYAKSENGTKKATGPKFDFDFWVEVMKIYYKRKTSKIATDAQIDAFRDKLVSKTPAERKEFVAACKEKDPHFRAAFLVVKAQMESKKAAKKDDGADVDLGLF